MLYHLYQAQDDLLQPLRAYARWGREWLARLPPDVRDLEFLRHVDAACDLISDAKLTHSRPAFAIDEISVEGRTVAVREEPVTATPFGTLLRFRKQDVDADHPKVLVVSPMACHFATLLRDTVRALLPEHDVYVTDWHNVRDVSLSSGSFDLDDYIEHLMRFLEQLGPGTHLMGVCQPCPAALVVTALMSEDAHPATPRTLTMMAGPVDTRQSPTSVNKRAHAHPLSWFERTVIHSVPGRYPGADRRVYPGFLQIAGFMSMNLTRHQDSFYKLYRARVERDEPKAAPIQQFYDEYLAVCDLPAEFYLQTMQRIFQEHHLPLGRFEFRGRPVDLGSIRSTALLTVEGGRDDICGLGQTRAALDLCPRLPASHKAEHVEQDAGHYGVFSGSRWSEHIYPRVRDWIRQHA